MRVAAPDQQMRLPTQRPTISVIIPVYNAAHLIARVVAPPIVAPAWESDLVTLTIAVTR